MSMETLLISILGIVAGFAAGWIWRKRTSKAKLIGELEKKKHENTRKLEEYLENRSRVANDEVEKLLGVSHATAFRYLEELEKSGKIRQVGRTGQNVYYEKTS